MADRDSKGLFVKGHKSFAYKGMNAGKRNSPKTEFKKGMTPWNKKGGEDRDCAVCSKTYYVPRYKLAQSRFCSNECRWAGVKIDPWKNKEVRSHSQDARDKISKHQRENPRRGELAYNWKGGTGTERHQAMGKIEYKEWRDAVFARDNYTCVECDASNIYLHADHIVRWADDESLRYEVDNGRTLCYKCHFAVTFGYSDDEAAERWGVPKKYRRVVI